MQDFSPIKKRILQYIDYKGISKYKFYNDSEITRSVLDKSSGISEDNVAKFIAYEPNINLEWLLTGKGSMLKENQKASLKEALEPGQGIPLIPLDAIAGFGEGEMQVMDYDIARYVVPEFEELNVDFMIRVKGSSMQPKYNSGDLVACRKLNLTDIFFQWNKVYVLDTDQGPLIKRLQKTKTKDHLLIVSDNKSYEPFELSLDHIHAIALVVGVIRLE